MMLSAVAMMAKDIKTVVFTTMPKMHCEACETKIKSNIRFVKGIKSINTNVSKQTVSIKYDADKTSPAMIQSGFKKIGYAASIVKESGKAEKTDGNTGASPKGK